jgi:predicted Zn-ribbon and HTH transcriptional regulator
MRHPLHICGETCRLICKKCGLKNWMNRLKDEGNCWKCKHEEDD